MRDFASYVSAAQQAVDRLLADDSPASDGERRYRDVAIALRKQSALFESSFLQIVRDLGEEGRLSWVGPAHELRELLRQLLEHLAQDDAVIQRPWYTLDTGAHGPTQRQRVRFILEERAKSSKQQRVAEQVALVEERVASLIRDTYGRASDAAHRGTDRDEVRKILQYFIAFLGDLLS